MGTYSIYLRSDTDQQIKNDAFKRGISPIELIKKCVETSINEKPYKHLEVKIDALFLIIEMLASEIAYTAGATRAASASAPRAVSEGNSLENSYKKVIENIKSNLEKQIY